jgi:hypothetical protein
MSNFITYRKSRIRFIEVAMKKIQKGLFRFQKASVLIVAFLSMLSTHQSASQNLQFANNISSSDGAVYEQQMITDAAGNIYIAGEFDGSQVIDFDPSSGAGIPRPGARGLNSDSYDDLFIAKYNSDGDYQWVIAIYTQNNSQDPSLTLGGITTDASGNLYIAGHVDGTTGAQVYFANTGTTIVSGQNSLGTLFKSAFVISVDSDGEENWTYNPYIGVAETHVTGVTTHGSGVYFYGYYSNGSPYGLPSTADPIQNAYVVELATSDGAFVDSERLMTSLSGGSSYIRIRDVAMDASGNMFLTGVFTNNVEFDPGTGTEYIDGGSTGSTFLAKYNSSYTFQWANNEYGQGNVLKLAPDGDVWVSRTDATYGAVIENWSSSGIKSTVVINMDYANQDMAFDSDGDLYTIGSRIHLNNEEFRKYNGSTGTKEFGYNHLGGKVIASNIGDEIVMAGGFNDLEDTDFDLNASIYQLEGSDNQDDLFLYAYSFEEDGSVPTSSSLSPVNGTDDVAEDTNLSITFSEPIRPYTNILSGTKSLYVRKKSDGSILHTIYAHGDELTVDGSTLTIDLSSDLPDNTEYYVTIQSGFVVDYSGNEFAGISSSTTWEFNTGIIDNTAPVPVNFDPDAGAVNVETEPDIYIDFDENVTAGTGFLALRRYSDDVLIESFNVDGSTGNIDLEDDYVGLYVSSPLASSTKYYITVCASCVEDLAGNSYAGFSSRDVWTFTTLDNTAPSITSFAPIDGTGSVAVDTDIQIIFEEAIQLVSSSSPAFLIYEEVSGTNVFTYSTQDTEVSVSGSTVTINPSTDLAASTEYGLEILPSFVTDLSGNEFGGLAQYTYSFTTGTTDVTAPMITALSPANGASDVADDLWEYSFTFDEPVSLVNGSSQLALKQSSNDGTYTNMLAATSGAVTISGNTVTLDFNYAGQLDALNMTAGNSYYLVIPTGTFADASGNSATAIGKAEWEFSIDDPDLIAPAISSFTPTDEASDVLVGEDLIIIFDESIKVGTGSILIRDYTSGSIVKNVDVTGGEVAVSDNQLTIDFATDLPYGSHLYVQVPAGSILDLADNSFGGFSSLETWDFSTEIEIDNTAPSILSLSPTDEAFDVQLDADLILTADEDIFPPVSGNILIKQATATVKTIAFDDGSVSFSGAEMTITNALAGLDYNTSYWVFVDGIVDGAGNELPETNAVSWNFTTGEAPITVASLDPTFEDMNVAVDADLILTFDKNVGVGSGTISIYRADDDQLKTSISNFVGAYITIGGNSVTFDFPVDLDHETEYYVQISPGYLRSASNSSDTWSGITDETTWLFTTATAPDLEAPSIVSLSPDHNDIDVSLTADLVLTADENIMLPASGDILIKQATATVASIPFDDHTVDVTGSSLTIADALTSLDYNTTYWVYVSGVTDLAGNPLPETNAGNWKFTTEEEPDTEGPVLVSSTPSHEGSGVALGATITLTFDETLVKTMGSIEIRRMSDDHLLIAKGVNESEVLFSGNSLQLTELHFPPNHTFYIQTIGEVFEDENGNGFDGFSKGDFTFSTVVQSDSDAPVVQGFLPLDDAVQVTEEEPELSITFDELIIEGTGTLLLYTYEDDDLVHTFFIDGTEDEYEVHQSTLYLFSDDLDPATHYYLTTSEGIVQDWNGNDFAGVTDKDTWDFITTDVAAPTVTELYPAHEAEDVALDQFTYTLSFDEEVRREPNTPGIWYAELVRLPGNVRVKFINATASESVLTVDGNTATIDLTSFGLGDLLPNTTYALKLVNIVDDASGNQFTGWNDFTSWTFTTQKAPQIITFDAPTDKTYGDASFGLSVTASSGLTTVIESSDSEVATVSGTTVTIMGAGTTTLTATQSGNESFLEAESVEHILTINKADLQITAVDQSKTYGEENPTFSLSYEGFVYDEDENDLISQAMTSSTADEFSAVGAYDIDVTGATSTNYEINMIAGSMSVTKAPLTISVDDQSKTYGEMNPTFTLRYSGFVNDENESVLSEDPILTTAADEMSHVGEYEVTPSEAVAENYDLIYEEGTLTVEKALLEIRAENHSIVYGEDLPTLTLSYDGFVNDDQQEDLDLIPTIETEATGTFGSEVGIYDITLTGGMDNNYDFHLISGELTIDQASQTINYDPVSEQLTTTSSVDLVASVSSGLALTYEILSGPASFSGNTIHLNGNAGTVEVSISQEGNINYLPVSESFSFNILDPSLTDQTITFASIGDQEYTSNDIELDVSASSGLTVSLEVVSGPAVITGQNLSITGVGEITLRATQSGNETFNPAETVTQTFTIGKASQTITFPQLEDKTYGDEAFDLAATSSAGLPVVYSSSDESVATVDGVTVTIHGSGEVILTADQEGSDLYQAATSTDQSMTVQKANQTITIDEIEDQSIASDPFEIAAATTSGLDLSYSIDGPATLDGATVTLEGTEGTVTIQVTQAGNNNYREASKTIFFEVIDDVSQDQTISFEEIPDTVYVTSAITLDAIASSGLEVTYSVISGPASVSGDQLSITGIGDIEVAADQSGNDEYRAAEQVIRAFTVSKASQILSTKTLEDLVYGSDTIAITATTNSGLPVSYQIVSGAASVTDDQMVLTGAGSVVINYSNEGNENYDALSYNDTIDVDQAILTVSIEDQASVFGLDLPEFDLSYEGFVGEDGIDDLDALPIAQTAAVKGSDAGDYEVTISGGLDDNYTFEYEYGVLTIAKATQQITFVPVENISLNQTSGVALSAMSSSGLAVSFHLIEGNGTITDANLAIHAAGTFKIAANQNGDHNYLPAEEVSISFEVTQTTSQMTQVITFEDIDAKVYGDQIALQAISSQGLEVVFELVSGSGILVDDLLTVSDTGTYEVRAIQSGNDTIAAAEPVSKEFYVDRALLTFDVDDTIISVGGEIPDLTYSVSGFRLEDDLTDIDELPILVVDLVNTEVPGPYDIKIEGGSDNHYSFDLIGGELQIEEVLGIGERIEIQTYPNPVSDMLHISGGAQDGEYVIYDLNGKVKKTLKSTESTSEIDVSFLKSGAYLLKYSDRKNSQSVRILIRH